MAGWSRYNSGTFSTIQNFRNLNCTKNYVSFKDEIVEQISTIKIHPHTNFCTRCQAVKEHIISKNNALNHCYNNNPLRNKLIDYQDIKDFIKKCPEINECIRNDPSRIKKTPSPKDPKLQTCKKDNTCTTGTALTKVTSKPKAVLETKTPEIIAPGRKESSDLSQKHAVVAHIKDEQIISDTESGKISSADSAGNSRELSASEDIQHSNTSGQGETSAQSSQILPHTTNGELGTLSGAPLKNTPIGESQPRNNSEVLDSAEVVPESGLILHQGVASSSVLEQVVSDKAGYRQDSKDIGSFTDNSSIHGSVDRTDDSRDVVNTIATEVTSSVEYTSTGVTHDQVVGSDHSCNGNPCIAGELSELTSGNENKQRTLSAIYEVILKNEGHMINASIPMGIVTILTLLFKYTPLWRILTKRKRNKRSHINEKLQRVLQQPSIASEERSVPFSYSAFEYS
ncbi:hypothetical protein PVNG_04131 [Plasmodium vivax North Korean]|uniref:Variable surface protein Vir18 n=1 Tax=Plasmodium vivax North Korean TaxID=1035514 RepID=A0A0J9TW88_PLAVI|nr:hypothetical protein PVNG_04131 [Plasmodium vivax North Korean]